jgi:hypothetical protein
LTAYAPLAQGRAANGPALATIARKHGATAAQVAIAWLLDQESVIAIPNAGRPESQKANLDALGISLGDEDRAAILAEGPALRPAAICTGMGCCRVNVPRFNGPFISKAGNLAKLGANRGGGSGSFFDMLPTAAVLACGATLPPR